jgi:hypothetical protein
MFTGKGGVGKTSLAAATGVKLAAWKMISDLVGSDPALNTAAWKTLRGTVGMLPSGEAGAGSAARPGNEAAESSAVH